MKKELGLIAVGALMAVMLIGAGVASAGDIETDGKVVSTATSGPPLAVSSMEMVDNLNADQLDGLEGSDLYTQAEVDTLVADLQAQIDALVTPPGTGLTVKDSAGLTLGPVYGLHWWAEYAHEQARPIFLFQYNGEAVFMLVAGNKDRLQMMPSAIGGSETWPRKVYFDQPGCTGSTYFERFSGGGLDGLRSTLYAVGRNDAMGSPRTLYRSDKVEAGQYVYAPSYLDELWNNCQSLDPPQELDNPWLAEIALDLDAEFTTPFVVE